MSEANGIWFVYRSHYEGPLSRRIRHLDAPSVLDWFALRMNEARTSDKPADVYIEELGGYVYGLGTIFEAAKEHSLPAPKSMRELERLLREHLYVEGGRENLRVDERSIRVLTDDDEVSLAYFFFDDAAVLEAPERLAWLLHETPKLPEAEREGTFTPPFTPKPVLPAGEGEGTTYACLFTFYDGDSLPGSVYELPGVRMPDLASHLRNVMPAKKQATWSREWLDTWPVELRLLRAMIEPGQISIAPALSKCAAYPLRAVGGGTNHSLLGVGTHANASHEFYKVGTGFHMDGDVTKSVVSVKHHAAVLCAHTSEFFGFEQWVLFDDVWAAANPSLAASILRYARQWDPFLDPAPPKLVESEEARKEREWNEALHARAAEAALPYRTTSKFSEGQIVEHSKFGRGLVRRVADSKIEVIFKDGVRLLAHGMQG